MAKATVTLAVLLLLFAVAQARFSLDLEKEAVSEEPETVFGESASKSGATTKFLLLPTEKPETEPEIETELDTVGIIDFDLEGADAKLTESEASTVETAEPEDSNSGSGADSDSVTVISFRPMNHQFKRFPSSFRRGHRCHHHHHRQGGPMFRTEEGQRVRSRERGYGNDMILSEEGMKFETVRPDSQRLVPGRWMSFRNGDGMRMHHHRFGRHEDMQHEREHEQENEHEDHEHHEHDHHEHDHHEHGHHEHEHHHEHENVFMRKIRKFLTNF